MALSSLPLSYCTNVHPATTVEMVVAGLDRYAVPIAAAYGRPMSAGLWLAQSVVSEILQSSGGVQQFTALLSAHGLTCHTLNAFPFGNFHDARVKEKVYLPDWTRPERLKYTMQCAQVLSALLPTEGEGSISTLPLGFKSAVGTNPAWLDAASDQLIACAVGLAALQNRTGKCIRLAIEPEPLCVLETTSEAVSFFSRLRGRAAKVEADEAVKTHLGICYDICHQAVEYEDAAASIQALVQAQIRVNKVHISCALELAEPATNVAGRAALLDYVEPRYLHQVIAKSTNGNVLRLTDLSEAAIREPSKDFLDAPTWRIHFHVPVDVDDLGPLKTTRYAIPQALAAVAALDYAPHLEVETYTWNVLPGASNDLVAGLSRELIATEELIAAERGRSGT